MNEQQLQKIEKKWWNPFHIGEIPTNGMDDISDLLAEVRRLKTVYVEAKKARQHDYATSDIEKDFLHQMQEIAKMQDVESRHVAADKLMCQLLGELGYKDIVLVFNNMKKWYS